MATHLFKVPLEHSDMLIRGLDLKAQVIEYQIVDREGKPMEPIKKDNFVINKGEVIFDKSRFIELNYANYISRVLNNQLQQGEL